MMLMLSHSETTEYSGILADHCDTPTFQVHGTLHLLRLFICIQTVLASAPGDQRNFALKVNYQHSFQSTWQSILKLATATEVTRYHHNVIY